MREHLASARGKSAYRHAGLEQRSMTGCVWGREEGVGMEAKKGLDKLAKAYCCEAHGLRSVMAS